MSDTVHYRKRGTKDVQTTTPAKFKEMCNKHPKSFERVPAPVPKAAKVPVPAPAPSTDKKASDKKA